MYCSCNVTAQCHSFSLKETACADGFMCRREFLLRAAYTVTYKPVMNLHAAAFFGLRTLTLASAAFNASVFSCGFSAARTAPAQMEEKRM